MVTLNHKTTIDWETQHDTAHGLMIHTFSERLKVVSNIKTGWIKVFKNGEILDAFSTSNWKVSDYTQFLSDLAMTEASVIQLASSN